MHRFASFVLAVPLAGLVGCMAGTTIEDDSLAGGDEVEDPSTQGGDGGDGGDVPEIPLGSLDAFLAISAPDCGSVAAGFEVVARHDTGEPASNLACELQFSDGSTATTCAGTHPFAEPGIYRVRGRVVDLDTNAEAALDQEVPVRGPIALAATVTAPSCGLYFDASVSGDFTELVRLVEPADRVVGYDAARGRYTVWAAGTYTLRLRAEQERTTGPICQEELVRTVEVVACPGDHEHPPDPECPH